MRKVLLISLAAASLFGCGSHDDKPNKAVSSTPAVTVKIEPAVILKPTELKARLTAQSKEAAGRPTDSTNLPAEERSADPVNRPVYYDFEWDRNGAKTDFTSDTVPAVAVVGGDIWEVRVHPRDSTDTSQVAQDVRNVGHTDGTITMGMFHTCVITPSERVKCFGSNGYGQLGIPVTDQADTYHEMTALPINEKFTRIKAGALHTCGLTKSNALVCWGANYYYNGYANYGELGRVTTGYDPNAGLPGYVTSLPEPVIDFEAADNTTCAVVQSGKVYCFGSNGFRNLGFGDTQNWYLGGSYMPIEVTGVTAKRIDSGESGFFCAYSDTKRHCWGGIFPNGWESPWSSDVTAITLLGAITHTVTSDGVLRLEGVMPDYSRMGMYYTHDVTGNTTFDLFPLMNTTYTEVIDLGDPVLDVNIRGNDIINAYEGDIVEFTSVALTDKKILATWKTTKIDGKWVRSDPVTMPTVTDIREFQSGYGRSCVITGGDFDCWGENIRTLKKTILPTDDKHIEHPVKINNWR